MMCGFQRGNTNVSRQQTKMNVQKKMVVANMNASTQLAAMFANAVMDLYSTRTNMIVKKVRVPKRSWRS